MIVRSRAGEKQAARHDLAAVTRDVRNIDFAESVVDSGKELAQLHDGCCADHGAFAAVTAGPPVRCNGEMLSGGIERIRMAPSTTRENTGAATSPP